MVDSSFVGVCFTDSIEGSNFRVIVAQFLQQRLERFIDLSLLHVFLFQAGRDCLTCWLLLIRSAIEEAEKMCSLIALIVRRKSERRPMTPMTTND